MKKRVFLAGVLIALTTAAVFAQQFTEGDYQATEINGQIRIDKYLVQLGGQVIVPAKIRNLPVTSIGGNAFIETKVSIVTIPEGVTSIGNGAFARCPNLGGVVLPRSLSSLGQNVFLDCPALQKITIPAGVTALGQGVLARCTSLTEVTFKDTIPSAQFDANAFQGMGDIRAKFYAGNANNGTPGTYTRAEGGQVWTKK